MIIRFEIKAKLNNPFSGKEIDIDIGDYRFDKVKDFKSKKDYYDYIMHKFSYELSRQMGLNI